MQAATTQKAAWEGSPGTSRSNGCNDEARTVTAPSPTEMSAPPRRSSSSVCARVGIASRTVVAP